MKLPARLFCCLLSISFSISAVAQELPPLSQIQAQAQKQVAKNKWIETWLLPAVTVTAVGADIWLAIRNKKLERINQQQTLYTKQLEKTLQDVRYENSNLRGQRKSLVRQRDNALKLWQDAEELLNKQKPPLLLSSKASPAASAESYMYLARSPLSKRFIKANYSQLSSITQQERKALIRDIDEVAKLSYSNARRILDQKVWGAKSISLKQLYIQAGKCIKLVAVTAVLGTLFSAQNVQAQKHISRLQNNPALFLQASAQELAAWEKNPQANALCRQIARAIGQAASLHLTEQEALDILPLANADLLKNQKTRQSIVNTQLAR